MAKNGSGAATSVLAVVASPDGNTVVVTYYSATSYDGAAFTTNPTFYFDFATGGSTNLTKMRYALLLKQ